MPILPKNGGGGGGPVAALVKFGIKKIGAVAMH